MKTRTPWDYLAACANQERRTEAEIYERSMANLYSVHWSVKQKTLCSGLGRHSGVLSPECRNSAVEAGLKDFPVWEGNLARVPSEV